MRPSWGNDKAPCAMEITLRYYPVPSAARVSEVTVDTYSKRRS